MEMSMVYNAMPRDIFEDILTRFKRRQAHKLDCMQTYMESSERDNWCDYIRTNDDLDGQEYELAKIERKLGYRMDSLLEDMRYTFKPLPKNYDDDDERFDSDSDSDSDYNSDEEYADLRVYSDEYVEDFDEE
jgi:hypothetical protein